MTYKEKDIYLKQYVEDGQRLYGLSQEIKKWREIGANMAPSGVPANGQSGSGGKVQTSAVNITDLVMEIERDIAGVAKEREEIKQTIKMARNRREELILNLRYINGLSVFDIANQIGKSEKWTREMLNKAVNSLEIIKKE